MTPNVSLSRTFRTLAGDAVADAVRRRIVPVIAVAALLSLLAVDSCTSLSVGTIEINGQVRDVGEAVGWGGLVLFVVLGLWTMVLGGVLASDHLVQTLDDGTANLTLARPVGRTSFALARLAGALAITWATGLVLLLGTALLLHLRQGLPVGPALWCTLACFTGAFVIAALAMTLSLVLPRAVTALLVFAAIGVQASLDALALFGFQLGGVALFLERTGPPLLRSQVAALLPWIEPLQPDISPLDLGLRLGLWALVSAALLSLSFHRVELGR